MSAPDRVTSAWRRPHDAPTTSAATSMAAAVLSGLRAEPKTMHPKWFYDAEGARLFEEITALPEYYPTRTELGILERHASDIAALAGPEVALVEYGSGAGRKIRLLLDALDRPVAYIPIDISGEQLHEVAETLGAEYPRVLIRPVRADYTRPLALPTLPGHHRLVAFFPGSTIGNFAPEDANTFLRSVRRTVGPDGAMILGLDRAKDPAELAAAYDDARGITAAFNRNLLVRMNRELAADFDLERFEHVARWHAEASRIEMHLRSTRDQVAMVAGVPIRFEKGETIWTESSYKYDRPMLDRLLTDTGFTIRQLWSDDDERFWVAYLA